jgi:hypothetical protein
MARLRAVRERQWAAGLLSWRPARPGTLLEPAVATMWVETSSARYFMHRETFEVLAWCEPRELGGRRRIEIGAFGSLAQAQAACEADAQRRAAGGG